MIRTEKQAIFSHLLVSFVYLCYCRVKLLVHHNVANSFNFFSLKVSCQIYYHTSLIFISECRLQNACLRIMKRAKMFFFFVKSQVLSLKQSTERTISIEADAKGILKEQPCGTIVFH